MPARLTIVAIAAAMLASAAHPQGLVTKGSEKGEKTPLHRQLQVQATVGQEVRVYGHLRLSQGCGQGPFRK